LITRLYGSDVCLVPLPILYARLVCVYRTVWLHYALRLLRLRAHGYVAVTVTLYTLTFTFTAAHFTFYWFCRSAFTFTFTALVGCSCPRYIAHSHVLPFAFYGYIIYRFTFCLPLLRGSRLLCYYVRAVGHRLPYRLRLPTVAAYIAVTFIYTPFLRGSIILFVYILLLLLTLFYYYCCCCFCASR